MVTKWLGDRCNLHARLCAHPEIYPGSDFVQTLQKSFGWNYNPRCPVCIHLCSYGTEKHQNNRECTESVGVFRVLKLNTKKQEQISDCHKNCLQLVIFIFGSFQTQRNFWPRVSQISSNNEGCNDLLCHAILTIILHIQTFCTFWAFCASFSSSPFASGSVRFAVLFSSLILLSASDRNFKWWSQWSPVKKCKGQTTQTGGHNTEVAYMNIHWQFF